MEYGLWCLDFKLSQNWTTSESGIKFILVLTLVWCRFEVLFPSSVLCLSLSVGFYRGQVSILNDPTFEWED